MTNGYDVRESEKRAMFELPLFPLNTVLFPGMPLSLHIFEERYKAMVSDCLPARQPFGVVLIRRGLEVGAHAEPHLIGCTAHITHMQNLAEGRINLIAIGRDRFRIHELRSNRPYLVGWVERLPALEGAASTMVPVGTSLRPLVQRYLTLLAEASESEIDLERLPDDPLELGYLAASVLQVPQQKKQEILAIDDAEALMRSLVTTFRHEIVLVKTMLQTPEVESVGPFSLN